MSDIVTRLQVSLPFFILKRGISFMVSYINSNHFYQLKLQLTFENITQIRKWREGASFG